MVRVVDDHQLAVRGFDLVDAGAVSAGRHAVSQPELPRALARSHTHLTPRIWAASPRVISLRKPFLM